MTATIGSLLDRLHHIAYNLDTESRPVPSETARLAASWAQLSRRLSVALNALPYDIDGAGETQRDHYLSILRPFDAPANNNTPPDPRLEDAVLVVGAIADLLVTNRTPFRVEAPAMWFFTNAKVHPPVYEWRDRNDPGATGLQSNLLAATYAIAEWTLNRLDISGTSNTRFARSLRHVASLCEAEAHADPEQRRSGLEHISATPADEPSLLGALSRWSHQAEQALHRRLVTSGTFAMLASDLRILTATTLRAVTAAQPDLPPAREALVGAFIGWTEVAAWPTNMRLGGPRPHDYIAASRELRSYVDAEFRTAKGWQSASELVDQFTLEHLRTIAHTVSQRVAWVGDALNKTIRDMTIGQGRLWIDTLTIKAIDPTFAKVRWIAQPDGSYPVVVPINWHIRRQPTDQAITLADTSREAAKHSKQAAQQIEQGLGPAAPRHERVSDLGLSRARLHALPSIGGGPSIGGSVPVDH